MPIHIFKLSVEVKTIFSHDAQHFGQSHITGIKQDNMMEPAKHCNTHQNLHLDSCNTYRTNI